MPKPSIYELIRCNHFAWRLSRRDGVWYADGRTNSISVGRHSLGTRDKVEAIDLLCRLDDACALKHGLIKTLTVRQSAAKLSLTEGRKLYESHCSRSRLVGGVKPSTSARYKHSFNKFISWAEKQGIHSFQQISTNLLEQYVGYLESQGRAQKTILNDVTTVKQCINWLMEEGHLVGNEPIKLKLRKPESQRAYCYRPVEVAAMLERCRQLPELNWLRHVILFLACTGMRINELINLKWCDVDLEIGRINLAEESGRALSDEPRRSLKSGHSRSFPIHPDLAAVLQSLPQRSSYVLAGNCGGKLVDDKVRQALVKDVLEPLKSQFPAVRGRQSLIDGRLHSFRHYFISQCAASLVPERVVMEWVGHADSAMVRHYFHLHDEEAKQHMQRLNLSGDITGRSSDKVPVGSSQQKGGDA